MSIQDFNEEDYLERIEGVLSNCLHNTPYDRRLHVLDNVPGLEQLKTRVTAGAGISSGDFTKKLVALLRENFTSEADFRERDSALTRFLQYLLEKDEELILEKNRELFCDEDRRLLQYFIKEWKTDYQDTCQNYIEFRRKTWNYKDDLSHEDWEILASYHSYFNFTENG